MKKGRSVGMLVILTTQKSTGDAIPTFIRDVCPVGLSFAQKTVEAAVAALGDEIRDWPDANPINLQDPAYVGVASMKHTSRSPASLRIRTPLRARRVTRPASPTRPPTSPRDPADLLLDKLPGVARRDSAHQARSSRRHPKRPDPTPRTCKALERR